MGGYLRAGGGSYSSPSTSQHALRSLWIDWGADAAFRELMGESLLPYVGHINEVFVPPKSTGIYFQFAPGKRADFIRLIDPSQPVGKVSLAMRGKTKRPLLIPDNPGAPDPTRHWRNLAASQGIGASFRQEGTGTSVHVAFNSNACDVHVDRHGFVKRGADGSVSWDLNGILRHLTVDLLGDKAPWLLVSAGYTDAQKRPLIEATLSPWLAVELPSLENSGRSEVKVGLMLSGTFR